MKQLFFSILMMLIVISSLFEPVQAQTPPVISIQPEQMQVGVGQEMEVAVAINGASGIYGFEIYLKFDPAAVEIVDADSNIAGVQVSLGTFLEPGLLVLNDADLTTGVIKFAMSQRDPALPKDGDGALLVIKFLGKSVSTTELVITSVLLATQDGTAVSADIKNGQIIVSEQAVPVNTATEIPKADNSGILVLPTPSGGESAPVMAVTATLEPTSIETEVATQVPTEAVVQTAADVEQNILPPGVDATEAVEPTEVVVQPVAPQTLFSQYGWVLAALGVIVIGLIVVGKLRNRR